MRLTVQCGVVGLTKFKQQILDNEYSNTQKVIKLAKEGLEWLPLFNQIPLYSANRQQATRYFSEGEFKNEYPISLRNDLVNLKRAKSFWFIKVPVYGIYGGIRLPIKPHREFPINAKICESKLLKKNGNYVVMLTFEFYAPKLRRCSSILAIDLGERFTATAVLWQDKMVMKAKFFGREIRGIRRHYSWLRRKLNERGLNKVVERIGKAESRRINTILHRISKEIVNLAVYYSAGIVLGDLKGISKRTRAKSKNFKRMVSGMPYYKLVQYICYKAEMLGVPVIQINEAYTSKICHVCEKIGKRKTQGLFYCENCGEYNADLNGAINIAKRVAIGYMPIGGVFCEQTRNGLVVSNQLPEAIS